MIQTPADLRHAIKDAEYIASRLKMPGHKLTIGERRAIALLLEGLADIGRRVFDPVARRDWSVIPREPTEDDVSLGLGL